MDSDTPTPAFVKALRSDVARFMGSLPLVQQLVITGALVGLAAGASTFIFDRMIVIAKSETLDRALPLPPYARALLLIVLPAFGAVMGWLLIERACPEAQGHGLDVVTKCIAEGDGRLRGRLNWVKSIASALTIGFGGSAGREGPSIQIGASAGSWIGQRLKLPARDLRTITAAGAAAGLAAAFGTPLAAVFFTMEVLLHDFASEAFPAVVIAAVTSVATARFLLGSERFLVKLTYEWRGTADFFAYVGMGLVIAPFGVLYHRATEWVERRTEGRFFKELPSWLKPGVGGALVGAIAIALPSVLGTGQSAINAALRGEAHGWPAVADAFGKIAATALTLGSGGSGGAFMPALFIGASAGSAWGSLLHHLWNFSAQPGVFALVGIACVLTAFYQAPVTGIVMALEISQDYDVLMPVMVACVISYLLTRRKHEETLVEQ